MHCVASVRVYFFFVVMFYNRLQSDSEGWLTHATFQDNNYGLRYRIGRHFKFTLGLFYYHVCSISEEGAHVQNRGHVQCVTCL